MGLCFHYKGSLRPEANLPELITEVKEIAIANKWDYFIFEPDFPEPDAHEEGNLYGLCITPPGSEMVCISFLPDRRLCSLINLQCFGKSEDPEEKEYLDWLSVKTQYASPVIHIQLVNMFRYLETKYFENFSFSDEGQYWETGDEELLTHNFNKLAFIIKQFGDALDTLEKLEGESTEDFVVRVAGELKKGINL